MGPDDGPPMRDPAAAVYCSEVSMTRLRLGGAGGARRARGRRRSSDISAPRRNGKYSRRQKIVGWTAIGVAVVLVAGTLFGYLKFRDVLDGINRIAVGDLGLRPPKLNNAMNILLIGSDSRAGRNGAIGGRVAQGQRSDTVMIVHVSPGHRHVYVLSFPRDTVVPIYQCAREPGFAGQTAVAGIEQLNATFADGGPGCLWKTLEHQTQIRIDDFIQLDFTGFISVINALHGVEVCNPTAITPSSYDQLSLTAGKHLLFGQKALEFWRLREDFGLGSDLQRIERDQLLMVALVQRILSSGVLHSLTKTYSIVQDIVHAHALTTDSTMSPLKLLGIGSSLAGIERKSVQFIEVPTITYPPNTNWVEWDPTQDPKLFSAVARDVKLPKVHKGVGATQGHRHAASPPLLAASKVSVEVLNGSGIQGIAGATGTALTARGFHVLGATSALNSNGTTDFNYVKSVVQYRSPTDLAAARTIAAQLTDVTLQLDSAVPAGQVNLVLGSDFKALAPEQSHSSSGQTQSKSKSPGNLAAQYSGYTAGTNVCKGYGSAYLGS
jgi:LCP family protein required for cell wall assembly